MAIELTFAERRVLGVLIEKAFTTPEQYPLSVNGVVVGSNQKSCRDPASSLDEAAVLESLESLRHKGFTTLVRGSRVDRWKQRFSETLLLEASETTILAELLLRGPQTDGEIRQRASRMRPLEGPEAVEQAIESMSARPEPLVRRLGPPGRKRGVKYAHTFYSQEEQPSEAPSQRLADAPPPPVVSPSATSERPAEPVYAPPPPPVAPLEPGATFAGSPPGGDDELKQEIEKLKERVAELEATFVKFLR